MKLQPFYGNGFPMLYAQVVEYRQMQQSLLHQDAHTFIKILYFPRLYDLNEICFCA